MTLDDVRALMQRAGSAFLATTDGERASVRPMGSAAWVDGELWYCAALRSAKCDDIRLCPNVEICAADPEWNHVRIKGTCAISTGRDDRAKLLELVPEVGHYVSGPDDPDFAVLRVSPSCIRAAASGAMEYEHVPV
jgi:uncharacterized pyridoxamine 5'-phosphate oxidase family protein